MDVFVFAIAVVQDNIHEVPCIHLAFAVDNLNINITGCVKRGNIFLANPLNTAMIDETIILVGCVYARPRLIYQRI